MANRYVLASVVSIMAFMGQVTHACTLWSAAGHASSEGTLLAKNRDWLPNQQQSLRLVTPRNGLRYLGLFVDSGRYKGIKAGVNQAGLTIVSATASSIPRAVRQSDHERHGVLTQVLAHYSSIEAVEANAEHVFSQAKPAFFLIADSHGVLRVEVGQQGRYQVLRVDQGTTAHTNHYENTALLDSPQKIGESSAARLARIRFLLSDTHIPLGLNDFTRMSQDRTAGLDDSLWRHGHEYTVASWQMALPANAPARLHLIVDNPQSPEQVEDLKLDQVFWSQPDGVLLPMPGKD